MSSDKVITTDASDRYHARSDCRGFQAGRTASDSQGTQVHEIREMTTAEAEGAGRTPCQHPDCREKWA